MMGDFANVLQIVGDARDQVAGLVVVEKTERELLNMAKEFAAHIGFNVDAEHVAPIGDHILEHGIQRIDAQQRGGGQNDHRPILAGQQLVDKLIDRKRKAQF